MKNFIIRFIACFIPIGSARRAFRKKYLRPSIKDRIRALDKKLDIITNSLCVLNEYNNKLEDRVNIVQNSVNDLNIKSNSISDTMNLLKDTSNSELSCLNLHQNDLINEIQYIKNFLTSTTDITKISPAHGTMRQVQLLNLKVLTEIDRICRKHKLSYWLDFGTLLGAIRHHGFVPWDDDVDIGMPAPDYAKFLKIVDKKLKGTCAMFKRVPSQIGKTLHRDFVPQTPQEWCEFIFWQLKGKLAFASDIFPYYFSDNTKTEIEDTLHQCCDLKSKLFENFTGYDDFQKIENAVLPLQQKICSETGKCLFLGAETRVYQPHIYETDDVFPLKEVDFEGHKFFVPNNYNKILIETYGDYFEFPHDMHRHLFLKELNAQELNKLNRLHDE